MKAIWNGNVIAESDDIVNMEGNSYFPIKAVHTEFLKDSDTQTVCHWKGTASYYDLEAGGKRDKDAVWHYHDPSGLAQSIKDRVAFGRNVEVIKD